MAEPNPDPTPDPDPKDPGKEKELEELKAKIEEAAKKIEKLQTERDELMKKMFKGGDSSEEKTVYDKMLELIGKYPKKRSAV